MQDKGGDIDVFRVTQVAWEILRDLVAKNDVKDDTFTSYLGVNASANADDDEASVDEDDDDWDDFDEELYAKYASNTSVPSYEFFEAADSEDVPGYKVSWRFFFIHTFILYDSFFNFHSCSYERIRWSWRRADGPNVPSALPRLPRMEFVWDRWTRLLDPMEDGIIWNVGGYL